MNVDHVDELAARRARLALNKEQDTALDTDLDTLAASFREAFGPSAKALVACSARLPEQARHWFVDWMTGQFRAALLDGLAR